MFVRSVQTAMSLLGQGAKQSVIHFSSLNHSLIVCTHKHGNLLFVSQFKHAAPLYKDFTHSAHFHRQTPIYYFNLSHKQCIPRYKQPVSVFAEGLYRTHSYRLCSHSNPLCVHLHGQLQIYLYCRAQCRFVYGRLWRFTPALTPGLAISIDWNRLSLILIPAWPKTIDQGAELSSGFNDLPAPSPVPHSPFS